MSKRQLSGSRGVITGASGGIGAALARELARRGAQLLLVARREKELQEAADSVRASGGCAEIVVADVAEHAAREAILERVEALWGGLDWLVNNAGVSAVGRFEAASAERLRRIMEVNFFAPAELTRLALAPLRRGRQPLVVNIGSILGRRGIPQCSEYCASKFALRGLSESLRAEFARLGIDLLLVAPGSTRTEFFEHLLEPAEVPWPRKHGVSAAFVARRAADAMERGKHEVMINFWGRLLIWADQFFPRLVDWRMERYG